MARSTYLNALARPQTVPVKGTVTNSAGGQSFKVSPEQKFRRFLILGTEGGSYYTDQRSQTMRATDFLMEVFGGKVEGLSPREAVDIIVDVSHRGAAPKQDPGLFALALAASHGSADDMGYALSKVGEVCRTGSTLFTFVSYIDQFRGWGRGLRRAVGNWYLNREAKDVAYQAVKYRQREGWSHRDLLRLSHPMTADPQMKATFDWITKGSVGEDTPRLVEGFLKAAEPGAKLPKIISEYGLSWEMIPTDKLNDAKVWEALLDGNVPIGALIRQLPRLTNLRMLSPLGKNSVLDSVVSRLTDREQLKRGRIHPLNVLNAMLTYSSGSGRSQSWKPEQQVVEALNAAFYLSFDAVEPANKRTLLALDVSGSMNWGNIAGMSLTPMQASAAMAMVQYRTEPKVDVMTFSHKFMPIDIARNDSLDSVMGKLGNLRFGGTDCALPMLHAEEEGLQVDTFIVYTDSETWYGEIHPFQALQRYRRASGIPARLVVVGMTADEFTIADPDDAGMMDVVGFDTSAPNLINAFSRGEV